MHYLEHGSGPPVVFVHGSGPGVNAYSNFFPNYREIAAAGYRAVLPDMIGFGWSSKPTGIDYTLELFVATLREFLDQMGIKRCVLLGNSLGRRDLDEATPSISPERVEQPGGHGPRGHRVARDLLQDARHPEDGLAVRRQRLRQGRAARSCSGCWPTTRSSSPTSWCSSAGTSCRRSPRTCSSRMVIPDLTPELGRIRCPLLGFWGVEDQFCPSSGNEKILRAVPESRFIMYSRCGHWAMIERAEEFNRYVIEFLRS